MYLLQSPVGNYSRLRLPFRAYIRAFGIVADMVEYSTYPHTCRVVVAGSARGGSVRRSHSRKLPRAGNWYVYYIPEIYLVHISSSPCGLLRLHRATRIPAARRHPVAVGKYVLGRLANTCKHRGWFMGCHSRDSTGWLGGRWEKTGV